MKHMSRAIRTPLSLALAGAIAALLMLAGSAFAAAPHRARHRPARRHRPQHHPFGGGGSISGAPWGTANGQAVNLYTLRNSSGMTVKITNYGGVVQSIWVPDRHGHLTNVALGFPTLADYVSDFTQGANSTSWPLPGGSGDVYFGAIIGRYANRIAGGVFHLNGQTYKLDVNNNGTTSLHGGYLGWNTHVWTPTTSTADGSGLACAQRQLPGRRGLPALAEPGLHGLPGAGQRDGDLHADP